MEVWPHNIHYSTPNREEGLRLFVSVVIPAYNRPALLARTLESLTAQSKESPAFEVHVADDGSEEDLLSTVESTVGLEIYYHRRERDRFGAGQARNLATASAKGDVVVFLDSDCLVGPEFITQHAAWHSSGTKTVVIGGRSKAVMGSEDALTDYRKRLRRRTASLQHGTEIFRSFVTSNVSLPLELFRETGGFDERFHRWGGEDTELGWRLWNGGALFIDDESILVTHQAEEDFAGGEEGRRRAHQMNMGLIRSLIPHRFYRREPPDAIPVVPKVSVVLHDVPPGSSHDTWHAFLSQPRTDFELIVVADIDDEEPLAGASAGDPRLSYVSSLHEAVVSAKGEYTCFLNGNGAPGTNLLTGVVQRLDKKPMMVTATVGYALPPVDGGPVRSRNGARDIDEGWQEAMPVCWFIRTREAAKLLDAGLGVDDLWEASQVWDLNLHWTSAGVRLPGAVRTVRPQDMTHSSVRRQRLAVEVVTRKRGLVDAASTFVRTRGLTRGEEQSEESSTRRDVRGRQEVRPAARYIGWAGNYNLGDEVMLESIRGLLPWADVSTSGDPGQLLILGGGTLINRSSYLKQVTERDTPRVERAVIGTGVASPDFWGIQEDPERWVRWLSSCVYVGVRGPYSLGRLQSWGFDSGVEVSGDSALLLARPEVTRAPGRIVIAPAWTKGRLWGESDESVVEALAECVRRFLAEGREVVALASSPDDDGQILQIQHRAGVSIEFVQGYLHSEKAIEAIASADLVVGERLHACVVAAAVGTPFVPIEYRPKLRDFAASVGVEHLVIRSDEVAGPVLSAHAAQALETGADQVTEQVDIYRDRLRAASRLIEHSVRA